MVLKVIQKQKQPSTKMMCPKCRYKFELKAGFREACPYCNSQNLVKYEDITADRILVESTQRMFDR